MKFQGSISPKEAVLSSLDYTLASLKVVLSAKYALEPKKSFDLLINTNKVSFENIAPMSPFLSRYQPSGKVQLTVGGTLAPAAEDFRWRGIVALHNASIRYSPSKKPVSEFTGNITFDDDSFESSQLTAKIGNTALTGKVIINSLDPVVFRTTFSSPHFDLADFNFQATPKAPQITNVKADISFHENNLSIKALSGNLNSSQLTVKGVISDIDHMKADLAITASYLDITDLILLGGVETGTTAPSTPRPNPTINATLKADKCTFDHLKFDKLATTATIANKSLLIEQLESDFGGGKLTAKGKIDFQSALTNYQTKIDFQAELTHYQTEFKLAKASTDKISKLIYGDSAQKEFTGTLTLEGDLNASGSNGDALKKSASGSIKMHSQKGMLRQFSWLSKVFSILNVSQLFKFRLPDMVSEGMPYNDLKATYAIKNGVISTDDLFLESNAMNMSLIGKHDFVRDNMDLTLGIQPLQTVDKVVSHIPIVGWILTGKNKAMFTTYFEIKGKSSDPKVSAIPITSLGKGVLGIFKRVFQLPVKLFTDTGEVILGN